MTGTPVYGHDLYDNAVLADPYPHYQALRDAGPIVWLPRHQLFALSRFAEVGAALRDDKVFSSACGVAANETINRFSAG